MIKAPRPVILACSGLSRGRFRASEERLVITLSTEALALVASFVDQHGEAALSAALGSPHLFDRGMRRGSTLAVESAGAFVDEGVPCALVYTFHPRAKKMGERTMVRLLTGESRSITVELPPAPEL